MSDIQDIVVMPGHSRPEYFQLWTEIVQKATGANRLLYVFCLDWGYDPKYDELIERFPYDCAVIRMDNIKLGLGKQSRNVLNGLIAAAKWAFGKGLVFYIEEDIFISRDFFRWHREVHRQQKDIFCSIGTKNNNTQYKVDDMPGHYYITDRPDYQALGSCFKPEMILEYIAPHFNSDYLYDPTSYCITNFPKSFIGKIWTEQDGLIRRIMELNGLQAAFPCVPRGFHAGFYGYNRQPEIMRMTYDQKLSLIREVCFDREKMKQWAIGPGYYLDSVPQDLDTDFTSLRRVEIEKIINK